MITIGMMATAHARLENPSGVPRRSQCVATRGGKLGYAQIEMATASAAITRPNQRLRIFLSPEASHEVPHDFLEHGGIQPIPDELSLALGRDQVRRLEHTQVVRDGGKRHRELLGDLARCAILFREELEDLAPSRIGQSAEQ